MLPSNFHTDNDLLHEHIIYSRVPNCGDSQLAHKDIWHHIQGFEEEMYHSGIFTDTNVQKKAVLAGYRLYVESQPFVFHISHEGRGRIWDDNQIRANLRFILNFNQSTNKDNWGFSDRRFKIKIL